MWIAAAVLSTGIGLPLPVTASDMATAEALFKQGRQLLQEGKTSQACDKFKESQRIDPSAGTMLNLANCHQALGKTATAWAEFLAAKRAALTAGRKEIVDLAAQRAEALKGSLSYLIVDLQAKVEGLEITRDGEILERASLGMKLPIDPGPHRIEAKAPGYESWTVEVPMADGQSKRIEIPLLKRKPQAVQLDPVQSEQNRTPLEDKPMALSTKDSGLPVLAYAIGAVGIASIGTGVVFTALAIGKNDKAEELCSDHKNCTDDAIAEADNANTFANVANVTLAIGAVAVATGIVLLVLDLNEESDSSFATSFTRWFEVGPAGTVKGRF